MMESDELWYMMPLLLLMYMAGTKEWGVPILMALMLTGSLRTLFPNPIMILDYNPFTTPAVGGAALVGLPDSSSAPQTELSALGTAAAVEPGSLLPPPEPTLAREKAVVREHASKLFSALPSLWNAHAREPGPRPSTTRKAAASHTSQ